MSFRRAGPLHTPQVNSVIGGYLAESFFREYQGLRDQLMGILGDEDLRLRLGGETASLGALCREIGEIEQAYVESFRTFRQDFAYRNPDPALEHSVVALKAWFAELDRDLMSAVEALSEDDIASRRIIRGDFGEEYFSRCPRPSSTSIERRCSSSTARPACTYGRSSGRFRSNGRTGSADRDAPPAGLDSDVRPGVRRSR
jgi:hypothetical protein